MWAWVGRTKAEAEAIRILAPDSARLAAEAGLEPVKMCREQARIIFGLTSADIERMKSGAIQVRVCGEVER
jgi:hypothetical protein